jgi:hypothetical protein
LSCLLEESRREPNGKLKLIGQFFLEPRAALKVNNKRFSLPELVNKQRRIVLMRPTRPILWTVIVIVLASNSVFAQRPRYQPPLRQPCDWLEPRTKLEEFDSRLETVIVRGSTHIMTAIGRNGSVRVDALELRDEGNATRATGVILELKDTTRQDATHPADEARLYIDYEEIDALIKAWDRVARTDDTITKLNNFESRYRTKGDLEIAVFRQTPGGSIAAAVSGGICDRVRIFLSLDELTKVRWMIVQAKARLDEIK